MRHALKSLFKGLSALMLIAGLAVRFVPATEAEAAALGPDHTRQDVMFKRMAWTAMTVAPDLTVGFYADATGIAPDTVRDLLVRVADGQPISSAAQATMAQDAPQSPAQTDGRRFEAGGALFVKANEDS